MSRYKIRPRRYKDEYIGHMGPETGTHMKEKYGSDFELVDTEMYDYLKGNCSHLELSQRKEEYIIAQSKDRDRLEYEMIKLEDERDS